MTDLSTAEGLAAYRAITQAPIIDLDAKTAAWEGWPGRVVVNANGSRPTLHLDDYPLTPTEARRIAASLTAALALVDQLAWCDLCVRLVAGPIEHAPWCGRAA